MRVRLGLAQPPGERLQERPRDLGMLFDERPELPDREPVAAQVGRCHDRRRARALVDERDLAEVVAWPESRAYLAADANGRVPVGDDEEAGPARALARDRRAFGEGALFHLMGESLEILLPEAGEERHLLQRLDGGGGGHRAGSYSVAGHGQRAPNRARMATQAALYGEIDLKLSWSERELPERERTKHVHRLHPYLGKFVPQLAEAFLRRYAKPGQLVWDPFAGSGTTLVQALESGYDAVGVDIAAFNCLLMRVKTAPYNVFLLEKDLRDALARRGTSHASATGYVSDWYAPRAAAELTHFRALA